MISLFSMQFQKGRRASFTLVEVLSSFVVVGVAIAASIGLVTSSMWGSNYLRHRSAAANIAASRVAALRSMTYADLTAMEEERTPVNDRGIVDADGNFHRTTTVNSEYMGTRVVTVEVEATWKHDRPDLSIEVSTIMIDESFLD